MTYIFGPVPSRRLGQSLGIDLIPPKTCTYDCLYCQVGRTTCLTAEPGLFVPTVEVIEELKDVIEKTRPDISGFLDISREELERVLKGPLIKGAIRKQEHDREVYYTAREKKIQAQSGNRGYGKIYI
jgi:hypothetical protein